MRWLELAIVSLWLLLLGSNIALLGSAISNRQASVCLRSPLQLRATSTTASEGWRLNDPDPNHPWNRYLVGHAAIRIDHIGSTAILGLAAKDVIDIQITVSDLNEADGLTNPLSDAGFRQGTAFEYDVFHKKPETDPELRKLYMREPEGERRAHIHIRELGRFNQRYALLFRDYLRSSEEVRAEYELLKRRAAQLFPDSIDGYLFLKDPMLHIIYEAASLWVEKVRWSPDEDYT